MGGEDGVLSNLLIVGEGVLESPCELRVQHVILELVLVVGVLEGNLLDDLIRIAWGQGVCLVRIRWVE